MVTFSESGAPATEEDIDVLESKLGFAVPRELRELLMTANGGRPEPSRMGGTDVSHCLELRPGKGSLWWTYELLIKTKRAAPENFLPFAMDSGGNFFLVDCQSGSVAVHLLLHDPTFQLVPLNFGLREFWEKLTD